MRTRIGTLLFIAVASAVLVSCALPGFKPLDTNRCSGPECEISVTVISIGDSSCQAAPVGDIDATAAGEHRITWRMTTPNFEFSGEPYKFGIFIKDDPDDDFKNAVVQGNGQTASLTLNHKKPGTRYRYGINVRRSNVINKPFCEPLDPWLIS